MDILIQAAQAAIIGGAITIGVFVFIDGKRSDQRSAMVCRAHGFNAGGKTSRHGCL